MSTTMTNATGHGDYFDLDYLIETVCAARAKLAATGETDMAGVTAAIFLVDLHDRLKAREEKANRPTPYAAALSILEQHRVLGYSALATEIREACGCGPVEAHGAIQMLHARGQAAIRSIGGTKTVHRD